MMVVHHLVPDFSWVQDVGGSLLVMVDQVQRAIAWTYRNATDCLVAWRSNCWACRS